MDSFGTLLSLYNLERKIFCRMVRVIGMGSDVAGLVLGFWLSLEWLGQVNIIQKVAAHNDRALTLAAAEAQAAVTYIQSEDEITNPPATPLPLTSNIADRDFTLDHFYQNRRALREGLELVLEGVCNLIFRDIMDEIVVGPPVVGPSASPSGAGTSQQGQVQGMAVGIPLGGPAPTTGVSLIAGGPTPVEVVDLATTQTSSSSISRSNLNPSARPFTLEVPLAMPVVPVQLRTLFVTFTTGYPLTKDEIYDFFTGMYGECVESVYVHEAAPGRGDHASLFGKVVFRSPSMIEHVMNGEELVKLIAAGKPIWCRRFDMRNQGRWKSSNK